MKLISLLPIILSTLLLNVSLASTPLTLVYNDYPPYEFIKNDGHAGISVDIIKKTAKKANVEINILNVPWSRALKMVKSGEADAIFSLFKTKERRKFLDYVETPIATAKEVAVSRADSSVSVRTFDDLKRYYIGLVKDNSHGEVFDNLEGLKKHYSVSSDIHLIRKLRGKRVDLIVITQSVFEYIVKKQGIPRHEFKVQPLEIYNAKLYMGFSKKHKNSKKLAELFNKTLINAN